MRCKECNEQIDETGEVACSQCYFDGVSTDYKNAPPLDELWNWINEYVKLCGGDPDKNVYGNVLRQEAVARIEDLVYGG